MDTTLARKDLTTERLLAALHQDAPRSRPSLLYRISLIGLTFLIVLLPLIYLAIVGLAGWGWWWYLTEGDAFVEEMEGRSWLLVRGGPLVVGAVLVFFLAKPLLARRPAEIEPLVLDPDRESRLFSYLDALCDAVGAPRPYEVHVDMQVNASASMAGGWFGLLSRKLVLTVGLPLVACLDLRQFTSILCHEFGHFAQGGAMRSQQVIWRVNQWFARVVYQRDAWDMRLEQWAKNAPWQAGIVLHVSRFFVWLTRQLLKGLMHVATLLSSALSRQMEFNADSHAYGRVGHEAFSDSMRNLAVIQLANAWAYNDLNAAWSAGRLGDDLVALIEDNLGQLEEADKNQAIEESLGGTPDMYASHPPTDERIQRALESGQADLLGLDARAKDLFDNWKALCLAVTREMYELQLGERFNAAKLVPAGEIAAEGRARIETDRCHDRYYRGWWRSFLKPRFDRVELSAPESVEAAREKLVQVRDKLLFEDAAASEAFEALGKALGDLINFRDAMALLGAKAKIEAKSFGLRRADAESAAEAEQEARERAALAASDLSRFEARTRTRIRLALSLLEEDPVSAAVEDAGARAKRGREALEVLFRIGEVHEELDELRIELNVLNSLRSRLTGEDDDQQQVSAYRRQGTRVSKAVVALRSSLTGIPYPFGAGDADHDLAAHAIPHPPKAGNYPSIHGSAEQALNATAEVEHRLLAELAATGTAVESALGLEPLPERE